MGGLTTSVVFRSLALSQGRHSSATLLQRGGSSVDATMQFASIMGDHFTRHVQSSSPLVLRFGGPSENV